MESVAGEELGLEVAWWEHEPETVTKAKSYLESKNFVIHMSDNIDEVENWVIGNGYDLLLADLHTESEKKGIDLIRGVQDSTKHIPIFPVTGYAKLYIKDLKRISENLTNKTIDKATLGDIGGVEQLRQKLLDETNGGKIRITESCSGFVEKQFDDKVLICVQMPNSDVEERVFPKELFYNNAIGEPSKYLEIITVERMRGNGMVLQTICKWLRDPDKKY